MSFSYLGEKIRDAAFALDPFQHVYIDNFLSDQHFTQISRAREIHVTGQTSDEELIKRLFEVGYKIIDFPGCITDWKEYVRWHANPAEGEIRNNSACEGYGVTLRLMNPDTPVLRDLIAYLESIEFQTELAAKFDVDLKDVFFDGGVQKYLDGYEISPHPDVRNKAATYMVNINQGPDSEKCNYHTHFMKLRHERQYVQALWEGNPDLERCWVPWEWCETVKMEPANNSIVLFSPADDTIHAVKTKYDHLKGQRTQLYGNLWFRNAPTLDKPEWNDLDIAGRLREPTVNINGGLRLRSRLKRLIERVSPASKKSDYVIEDRLRYDDRRDSQPV